MLDRRLQPPAGFAIGSPRLLAPPDGANVEPFAEFRERLRREIERRERAAGREAGHVGAGPAAGGSSSHRLQVAAEHGAEIADDARASRTDRRTVPRPRAPCRARARRCRCRRGRCATSAAEPEARVLRDLRPRRHVPVRPAAAHVPEEDAGPERGDAARPPRRRAAREREADVVDLAPGCRSSRRRRGSRRPCSSASVRR